MRERKQARLGNHDYSQAGGYFTSGNPTLYNMDRLDIAGSRMAG